MQRLAQWNRAGVPRSVIARWGDGYGWRATEAERNGWGWRSEIMIFRASIEMLISAQVGLRIIKSPGIWCRNSYKDVAGGN